LVTSIGQAGLGVTRVTVSRRFGRGCTDPYLTFEPGAIRYKEALGSHIADQVTGRVDDDAPRSGHVANGVAPNIDRCITNRTSG